MSEINETNSRLSFEVQSFRKIPNPYAGKGGNPDGDDQAQMYIAICDVTKIPNNIPMKTNPRKQKLTTAVAKKIKASLLDQSAFDFYQLNRGLLISAASASFNNYNNELTITFEDDDVHGDVDGGHTYEIIKECVKSGLIEPNTQFVKLEILCGIESVFTQLAAARNTSVQVKDTSIAELEHKFDIIKTGVGKEDFFSEIFFQENDEGSIDVQEVLAILNMFNIDRYPTKNMDDYPTVSYNGRKSCVTYYLKTYDEYGNNSNNPYVKMLPIMSDIFKLYNRLEVRASDYYSSKVPNGRYGSTKGVSVAKDSNHLFSARFSKDKMNYQTPTGFIYPMLGSLRAAVAVDEEGNYCWSTDPFELLDDIGPKLVETTVERSRSLGGNPTAVGKDKGNWNTLFFLAKLMLK